MARVRQGRTIGDVEIFGIKNLQIGIDHPGFWAGRHPAPAGMMPRAVQSFRNIGKNLEFIKNVVMRFKKRFQKLDRRQLVVLGNSPVYGESVMTLQRDVILMIGQLFQKS